MCSSDLPWCFIGPHSLLEPGTVLGRGCIVRAGSVLRGTYPEHSVVAGNPAVVVGDARQGDQRWLADHPELRSAYEAWAGVRPADDPVGALGPAGPGQARP